MSQEATFTQEIEDDFSPLDAPVKQRKYTQHHIADAQIVEELDEPTFMPPSISDFDDSEDTPEYNEPERPFNEAFNELPKKDKEMGAKMAVEVTLNLYEKGCSLLGKLAEIPEQKLDRLIAEGEIDPNIEIPVQGGSVGVKEFAKEFNESTKDAFEVSDDFKEQVKPVMERVFQKRGIGMTDEQTLIYMFGTDLLAKGASAFMLRKTVNGVLDSLVENTKLLREQNVMYQNPVKTTSTTENSYSETVAQTIPDEKPKPRRSKPKTNLDEQVEFFEPEEAGSVYSNLQSGDGFKSETPISDNMPKFGDAEILSGIDNVERLSKTIEKPVRRTKRTMTKRAVVRKTPRNKKEND